MLERIKTCINDNYGSRRGLLRHVVCSLQYHAGGYRRYQQIDWERVERLVFVCHGNICRSPLGEIVARKAGVSAVSYGLRCRDGATANPRATRYADSIGLSLADHRTQNIQHYSPLASDLIVVMEPEHLVSLGLENSKAQITLAGLWQRRPNPYIHDPYCSSDAFFILCESRVRAAAESIAGRLAGLLAVS